MNAGAHFVYINFLCHIKHLPFPRFLSSTIFKLFRRVVRNILQEAIIYQWKTGNFLPNIFVLLSSLEIVEELLVTPSLFFFFFPLPFPVVSEKNLKSIFSRT